MKWERILCFFGFHIEKKIEYIESDNVRTETCIYCNKIVDRLELYPVVH